MKQNNRLLGFAMALILFGMMSVSAAPSSGDSSSNIAQGRTIQVSVSPTFIALDRGNTATITVQMLGQSSAGRTVQLRTTRGNISPVTAITDSRGIAIAHLLVGPNDAGIAVISAAIDNLPPGYVNVTIAGSDMNPVQLPQLPVNGGQPDQPMQLQGELQVASPNLPADGESTTVVDFWLYAGDEPIPNEPISLSTTLGQIDSSSVTDEEGHAQVLYTAPNKPGTAIITAVAGPLRKTAQIKIVPIQETSKPQYITLSVKPGSVLADGISKVEVIAMVYDGKNQPIAKLPVSFTTSLGVLGSSTITTDDSGRALNSLLSKSTGTANVTAEVNGIRMNAQVDFLNAPANPQATTAPVMPASPPVDFLGWNSVRSAYIAENWFFRQMQTYSNNKPTTALVLYVIEKGKTVAEIPINDGSQFIYDQYGIAHGYATEDNGTVRLKIIGKDETLKDGKILRNIPLTLPDGYHLEEAICASSYGTLNPNVLSKQLLLISVKNPTTELRMVFAILPNQDDPKQIADNVAAFGYSGDGYFAVATADGVIQLFQPSSTKAIFQAKNEGGASRIAVAPKGAWVAVAGDMNKLPQNIALFTNDGKLITTFNAGCTRLAFAGDKGLLTTDGTKLAYYDMSTKQRVWNIDGTFERSMVINGVGILASRRELQSGGPMIPRVMIMRLTDGKILASQELMPIMGSIGIVPPVAGGLPGIIADSYLLRFNMPANR